MNISRALTIVVFLISGGLLQTASGQRRSGSPSSRPANPVASQHPTRGRVAEPGVDKYWAAQRSIEAATQQLEAYLRESPSGERAATARQQIAVLRSLAITATRPEWVSMNRQIPLPEVPEWRVASFDRQPDRARASIEITCKREDGGNCYFDPFDRHPLVLVDNAGRYYPMLDSSITPSDVQFRNDGRAVLSGGRTITVAVDFAPLAAGAVAGQIYYRDDNRAMPARFSLMR